MDRAGDDERRLGNAAMLARQMPATLTVSELRTAVQQHLRQSGALRTLKTQLRGMVLQGIMQTQKHAGPLCLRNRAPHAHVVQPGDTLEAFESSRQPHCASSSSRTAVLPSTGHTAAEDTHDTLPTGVAWARHVADALVVDHLRRIGCVMSLALFSTEAEVLPLSDVGSPAAEEAYLQQLLLASSFPSSSFACADASAHHRLGRPSGTHEEAAATANTANTVDTQIHLAQHEREHSGDNDVQQACVRTWGETHNSTRAHGQPCVASPTLSRRSVLQYVVEQHLKQVVSNESVHWRANSVQHCGTQTHISHSCTKANAATAAAASSEASGTDRCGGGMSLECKLAAVNAQYALRWSYYGQSSDLDSNTCNGNFFLRPAVERRLQQYRDDMHAQLREEYAQKYATLEQTRLQEVRDAAEARWTVFVQSKQEELAECERSLRERVEQERAQLRQERIALAAQRERLSSQRREMQEQLRAQEEATSVQLSVQRELYNKLHTLQLQASQWEELATARLLEAEAARERVARTVHEHRRLCEEHAKELAMRDEQADGLRQRIRSLLAGRGEREADLLRPTLHSSNTNNDTYYNTAHSNKDNHSCYTARENNRNNTEATARINSPMSRGGGALSVPCLQQASGLNKSRMRENDDANGKRGNHNMEYTHELPREGEGETMPSQLPRLQPCSRPVADTHKSKAEQAGDASAKSPQKQQPHSSQSSSHEPSSATATAAASKSPLPPAEVDAQNARVSEAADRATDSNSRNENDARSMQDTDTDTNSRSDSKDNNGNSRSTISSSIRSSGKDTSSSSSSSHDNKDANETSIEASRRAAAAAARESHAQESTERELAADKDATSATGLCQRFQEQQEESRQEQRRSLLSEEERERAELISSADADRRGIEWIATSQLDAIVATDSATRQQTKNVASGGDDDAFFAALAASNHPLVGGGALSPSHTAGGAAYMQRQQEESDTTDNNVFDDPSGGDEDDDFLFGRDSTRSSSSSF